MTFKVLALVVEQFLARLVNFSTVKNTWSANVKFLHRFVTNTFR